MFHKQALIIGNDAYTGNNQLESCVYDTKTMTSSLHSIGFKVTSATDLDNSNMRSVVHRFARSIRPGAVVVFYFSGHGLQFNGNNLLLPIDITDIDDASAHKIPNAQSFLKEMHHNRPRVVIFILDCCRSRISFPYTERRRGIFDKRPKVRGGLTAMGGPPSTIIAFSCAADATSLASSETRPNSMYTHHLLRYITMPNIDIDILLKHTAVAVQRDSENDQLPFLYTNCNEPIILNSNPWPNAMPYKAIMMASDRHRHQKQYITHSIWPQTGYFSHHYNGSFYKPNKQYSLYKNPWYSAKRYPYRYT